MKVILIADQHNIGHGPHFLFKSLQIIKSQKIRCKFGLEIPSMDALGKFLYNDILEENKNVTLNDPMCRLAQIRARKMFIEYSLKLFDIFVADIQNGKSFEIRENSMAEVIYKQFLKTPLPDVIVMLVGTLHIPGIIEKLKQLNGNINVICFAPMIQSMGFFKNVISCFVKEQGFFFSQKNIDKAEKKIRNFLDSKSAKIELLANNIDISLRT